VAEAIEGSSLIRVITVPRIGTDRDALRGRGPKRSENVASRLTRAIRRILSETNSPRHGTRAPFSTCWPSPSRPAADLPRTDAYHTGNATPELFAVDQVAVEPLPWPGNPAKPVDPLNLELFAVDKVAVEPPP
jgi:hypothetical protein